MTSPTQEKPKPTITVHLPDRGFLAASSAAPSSPTSPAPTTPRSSPCTGTLADERDVLPTTNSAARCSRSRRSTPPATSPPRKWPTWSTAQSIDMNAGTRHRRHRARRWPPARTPANFGAFQVGVAREYLADGRAADHVDGRQRRADRARPRRRRRTGRLVNGTSPLSQVLQVYSSTAAALDRRPGRQRRRRRGSDRARHVDSRRSPTARST